MEEYSFSQGHHICTSIVCHPFALSSCSFHSKRDIELARHSFIYTGEEFPVGRMEIGKLSSLKRYLGHGKDRQSGTTTSLATEEGGDNEPEVEILVGGSTEDVVAGNSTRIHAVNPRGSKLFEIARCFPTSSDGKVYLVYTSTAEQTAPEIWLHRETADRWYHLADDFTRYFRMMLVHLGLPVWQCCAVGVPLPTWVEQVYFLVGPHLLPNIIEPTETISSSLWNNGPTNLLDPNIFKGKETKQRNPRKK